MKRHKSGAKAADFGRELLAALDRPCFGDELFNHVPDTVFFVKDAQARYVCVNETLLRRCGLSRKAELIGRTAREVFPEPLGSSFSDQDTRVLHDGAALHGQLELHHTLDGAQGWCLTWKQPLAASDGRIVGLMGISRDVAAPGGIRQDLTAISGVLDFIRAHIDEPFRLNELARRADLSVFQFDQRIRTLFGLSAGQYLTRARIDRACTLLAHSHEPIARVAQACGYGDQAAFTRQFRKSVGMTPKAYRVLVGVDGPG